MDLRLHHRGGEENLRCSHDRCDYRCFDRSSSLIRRRRLDLDGDSRSLEVRKVLDGAQQDGGLNKERSAQLLFDGGRVDNGKCTVGNVKDGSGNNKEVGVGVNDGFKDNASGSNLKRYVSFYFTNFPAQLPKFYLRKGFEVCGILEDVYVAKKRNKFGQPYGFVKYFNVKNVSKMTNALNNVWFGNFRVKASVAMFDRNVSRVDRKMESQKEEQVGAPLLQDGKQESLKLQASNINGEAIKLPERLPQREEVQVGDIVVELGARKVNLTHQKAHKEGFVSPPEKVVKQADTVKECRRFMKSYRSKNVDAVQSECGEGHVDLDVNRDVDLLINNITEGLEDAACIDVQSMREEEPLVKQNAGEPEKMLEQKYDSPRPGSINAEIYSNVRSSSQDQGVRHARPSVEETKLQNCDVLLCSSLWGSSFHGFSFRPSVGASGGILTLWDSFEVEMWWTESREHVLWCHGHFTKSGEEFFVANIYAPCDDLVKQRLWESISERLQSLAGKRVCVCGDFNAVKRVDERRSVRGGHRSLDHVPFSRFIEDNSLVDLPLIGRKFTWFKGDGCSMSRLDRFLLSEEWCLVWPNCRQVARLRGLSDHCPLVLSADEEDWGPRPSRMLKCWKDVPGYHSFVREKWNSFQVDGWAGHVLKEKFKLIKAGLKEWHRVHTHNLPSRIESLKARLAALDEKGEEEVHTEEELTEFHGVSLDIQSLSRMHASISWQQSRSLWLKDGDANSKYFHSVLVSRGRRNAMSVIQVDGITIEGVEPIRQAVFSHFESHFKASNVDRPGVADLQFKSLNHVENGSLIKPFTEAEVKSAAMVARNLFQGYSFGEQGMVSVSHLQFADDTLLLGVKSWANVRALRVVLVLFETMSGLKVNFNKSMLVGVNISDSWLGEAASVLCCKVGKIPFLYLGLQIGGDPRRLSFWDPVLHRIKNRLSGWKSRFLSFGGRLVLLRSVLTSLPVYALSFFKAPSDSGGLWFRVLAARYGVEGGRIRDGGRRGSLWWREIVRIREGGGESSGRWFGEHVVRRVGDGSETFFWTDPWVDGTPLCERFGRLFALTVNKYCTVAEMGALGWGVDGGAWVWRRQLRAWEEEMLGECQALLSNISLQAISLDRWQWQPDPDTGYTVRGAYQLLISHDLVTMDAADNLIWHPQVPLKVSILAWRLLRDRLPTRVNLVTRRVLSPTAHTCVFGCGEAESAHHVFISCGFVGSLWDLVRSWIDIPLVEFVSLRDHFIQFTSSAGGSRARRSFLQLIWLACVWVVWTERNHRLFRGSADMPHVLLDKIKLFSFRWLKSTNITLALNYHSWWSSPRLCLGLDSFLEKSYSILRYLSQQQECDIGL
ncbi:unnamed protein product [Trifolium pratense]|uniref:Uncharacterized protein n=1 Tax=Trifolium pratense TaxID=57577 RepID=A0ACB0KJG3_TRIPR|nr:unnamed protein product [Trifolium pratense]